MNVVSPNDAAPLDELRDLALDLRWAWRPEIGSVLSGSRRRWTHRGRSRSVDDPAPGENEEASALSMTRGRTNANGWTEYRVALDRLTAPLEAYTASVLPAAAGPSGALAVPLVAWQR